MLLLQMMSDANYLYLSKRLPLLLVRLTTPLLLIIFVLLNYYKCQRRRTMHVQVYSIVIVTVVLSQTIMSQISTPQHSLLVICIFLFQTKIQNDAASVSSASHLANVPRTFHANRIPIEQQQIITLLSMNLTDGEIAHPENLGEFYTEIGLT